MHKSQSLGKGQNWMRAWVWHKASALNPVPHSHRGSVWNFQSQSPGHRLGALMSDPTLTASEPQSSGPGPMTRGSSPSQPAPLCLTIPPPSCQCRQGCRRALEGEGPRAGDCRENTHVLHEVQEAPLSISPDLSLPA